MIWVIGIPKAALVKAHETEHPRPDGIRLGRITVDYDDKVGSGRYVATNDWSYGEWICHHYQSHLQPYISCIRLKEVSGEVLLAVGFTGWYPLRNAKWAHECKYFPVTQEGLPEDYKTE